MFPSATRPLILSLILTLGACATTDSTTPATSSPDDSNRTVQTGPTTHVDPPRSTPSASPAPTTGGAAAPVAVSTGLMGSTYSRGNTPPDPLIDDWHVTRRIVVPEHRALDFLAVHRGSSASLIVAKRGPRLDRQRFQYVISDELQVPRHDSTVKETACAISPKAAPTLFALVDTQDRGVVWAATVTPLGLIKTIETDKAKPLHCAVEENGRTAKYTFTWKGSLTR